MKKLIYLAIFSSPLLVVGLVLVMAASLLVGPLPSSSAAQPDPTPAAEEEIGDKIKIYQEAAVKMCPGLPWSILAGIFQMESNHGTNNGTSGAGAQGPGQFLPATWEVYKYRASQDGNQPDINDFSDAVYSAARLLCANANGDPSSLVNQRSAIWNYNHDPVYVERVLAYAAQYGQAPNVAPAVTTTIPAPAPPPPNPRVTPPSPPPSAPTPPTTSPSPPPPVVEPEKLVPQIDGLAALLNNPRVILLGPTRGDLVSGRIDSRVVGVISLMLEFDGQPHSLVVTSLQTGHSKYVNGTRNISYHFSGRAMDIGAIDGQVVSPRSDLAKRATEALARLPAPYRPTEIGSPFGLRCGGCFSNADHLDHIHLGFR